jgi:hypothetical protein
LRRHESGAAFPAVTGWTRVVALRKCVVIPLGIRD